MAKTATKARPRGRFGSCLMNGLSVHLAAAVVFGAGYYYLYADTCDRGQRLTTSLALAAGVDVLLALAVLFVTRAKNKGAWLTASLGWAASYVIVVALFGAGVTYARTLAPGC